MEDYLLHPHTCIFTVGLPGKKNAREFASLGLSGLVLFVLSPVGTPNSLGY